jgi:hypothetical protein
MLRAISGTVRDQGKDLLSWRPVAPVSRRSHPEVRGSGRRIGVGYFPSRALLSKPAEKFRSREDKPPIGRS